MKRTSITRPSLLLVPLMLGVAACGSERDDTTVTTDTTVPAGTVPADPMAGDGMGGMDSGMGAGGTGMGTTPGGAVPPSTIEPNTTDTMITPEEPGAMGNTGTGMETGIGNTNVDSGTR